MARTTSKASGADLSRLRRFAMNHLGVKMTDDMDGAKIFRSDYLDLLDRYFENSQYDDKQDWDAGAKYDEYIPIRDRKPRIIYNLGKAIVNKVVAKMCGESTFPKFIIEGDDDDTAFLRTVCKAAKFRSKMLEPMRRMFISGAVFVRYYLVNGAIQIEHARSKYCYPVFDELGELEQIEIKYVYADWQDKDRNGKPKDKWYRLLMTKTDDTLFDNPEYKPGVKPTFTIVSQATHGLGWVQGEWFSTSKDKFEFDGIGLYADILDFIDELNYSLSQTSQAVAASQEPQLAVKGMDEDEIGSLIKSSQKAWNLGRAGEAEYLSPDVAAIKEASDQRENMRNNALDVARIVLHDPENIKGQAQSGEALKQLYAPLIELIDELRTALEEPFTNLLIKIAMTALHCNAQGMETAIQTPPGYMPESLDITVQWPNIFPATLADTAVMANAANVFQQAGVVSRESLTRWVASNTAIIDNAEEELKKIETQEPLPSPFGTFGEPGQ
jgi:hypothetical protein